MQFLETFFEKHWRRGWAYIHVFLAVCRNLFTNIQYLVKVLGLDTLLLNCPTDTNKNGISLKQSHWKNLIKAIFLLVEVCSEKCVLFNCLGLIGWHSTEIHFVNDSCQSSLNFFFRIIKMSFSFRYVHWLAIISMKMPYLK